MCTGCTQYPHSTHFSSFYVIHSYSTWFNHLDNAINTYPILSSLSPAYFPRQVPDNKHKIHRSSYATGKITSITPRQTHIDHRHTPSNPTEMPTWDNARTRRVEDTSSPRPEDMEMEPLNQPRRSPSVPRSPASFMGPPARTGTTPSFYGEQNIHARRSPGPQSPPAATAPLSPYDEPYGDYPYGMSPPGPTPAPAPYAPRQYTPMPSISPAPAAYTPSQYTPMPSTISTPDPVPYRQPSPGVAVPYRQPSPGPGMPFRQPSPGPGAPFRQPSPGPGVPFRQQSPAVPFRQPSPGFPQPPSYRGLSPAASPASPPPAFSETNNGPGRPPSLLQSGRKPSVNF